MTETDPEAPGLSVVTVLYGGVDVLRETMPTWAASAGEAVEFVIVDHSPEPVSEVVELISWSTYHWDPSNPGFAAGVNRGIEMATRQTVLLLNPDVFLDRQSIDLLNRAAPGGLCAVGLETDGRVSVGIDYTAWGFCRDRISPRRHLVGPSGGAALFTKTVFQKVGPYPEHLFAWGEDAEWALIAHTKGVPSQELPVILRHVGGHSVASQAGQRLKTKLLIRNRIATYRRLLSRPLQSWLLIPFFSAVAANGARKANQGMLGPYLNGVWEGLTMPLPEAAKRVTLSDWRVLTSRRNLSAGFPIGHKSYSRRG